MTIRLAKDKPGEVSGHRAWILLEAMRVIQLGVCSAVYGKVTLACTHRGGAQEARLTDLINDVGLGRCPFLSHGLQQWVYLIYTS